MSTCQENRISEEQFEAAANAHRDAQGRFAKGHPGGPGNPFGRRVAALRTALLEEITDDDIQAVIRKLIEMSKSGNLQAAKLLLSYANGKPTPAPNPDHVEIDEWQYFEKTAAMSDTVDMVVRSTEPETILNMGRELRPIMSELAFQKLAKRLKVPSPNGDFSPPPATDGTAPSTNGLHGASAAPQPMGNAPDSSTPAWFNSPRFEVAT